MKRTISIRKEDIPKTRKPLPKQTGGAHRDRRRVTKHPKREREGWS